MVLHLFISFLGGVPLYIPYGLYNGTSLGGTTRGILEGFPGRVLSFSLIPLNGFSTNSLFNPFVSGRNVILRSYIL